MDLLAKFTTISTTTQYCPSYGSGSRYFVDIKNNREFLGFLRQTLLRNIVKATAQVLVFDIQPCFADLMVYYDKHYRAVLS